MLYTPQPPRTALVVSMHRQLEANATYGDLPQNHLRVTKMLRCESW